MFYPFSGDSVRIGACIGKNAEFELTMAGSVDAKWSTKKADEEWIEVNSISELDADHVGNKYFYDKSTGWVFDQGRYIKWGNKPTKYYFGYIVSCVVIIPGSGKIFSTVHLYVITRQSLHYGHLI